jgi:hypothetical protein
MEYPRPEDGNMSRSFMVTRKRLKELALRSVLFGAGTVAGLAGTSLILAAFADDSLTTPSPEWLEAQEASPEEIAAEMLEDTESLFSTPGVGLKTSREAALPRLAPTASLERLLKPLALPTQAATYRVEIDVFKRPKGLSMDREFMTLKVDGVLQDAYVISTAKPGKYTIEGAYPVNIERRSGISNRTAKPYPWRRSSKYQNSPMFWGLHLSGGYWTHSTTHYGELGGPASMGCVRMTFPAAMETWDTVVNRAGGSAIVRIHGSGSQSALTAMSGMGAQPQWLKDRVEKDLADAHSVSSGEYTGVGHARPGQALIFPSCEGVDCFEYFGRKKPALPN